MIFIVASLYVDDKKRTPEMKNNISKFDGSKINNVGAKHLDFEATIANLLPNHFTSLLARKETLLKTQEVMNPV